MQQAEIFPLNQARHGAEVALGPYYDQVVRGMGLEPKDLPDCLFFTFCGDILGSSGEHYKKGAPIGFNAARARASLNFSDDFMESVAMHRMPDLPRSYDLATLMRYRDIFHDFIRDHFQAMGQTYSPWFGALFNAKTLPEYGDVLRAHSSCGAAMRATIVAADGHDDIGALPYFLISHAHLEAIEGAYAVMGVARAALAGQDFAAALGGAAQAAGAGRKLTQIFQERQGWPKQDFAPFPPLIQHVLATGDAYATIDSIERDGIETRFVVPAALLCVQKALAQPSAGGGAQSIITHGLEIGGDPDTICSIALGLYGLFRPAAREIIGNFVVSNVQQKAPS